MGLVDYSESDSSASESEAPTKKTTTKAPPKKPAFQKVVDRSNPGKIIVNLPSASSSTTENTLENEPPAKRARTGGGGGLFSGFNSFLPPPKNTGKAALNKSARGSQTRPGVNLKTSAEKGFSRDEDVSGDFGSAADATASGGLSLPPPKRPAEPSVPEDMKPADEVKLVGKPLMFRPLSVARNTKKKKTPNPAISKASTTSSPQISTLSTSTAPKDTPPPPKKTSLFSLHTEEPSISAESTTESGSYEPLFETGTADSLGDYSQHSNYGQPVSVPPSVTRGNESLDSIANDLNLSAAARRELFGRGGNLQTAKKVINFNMDKEYQHNEELRASGEQQIHNPVRAIQNGKHSLQQLVQNVSNQREALEDSFAKGRNNKREAASRYGW